MSPSDTQVRPPAGPEHASRSRRRWGAALLVAAVAVTGVLLAADWWERHREERSAVPEPAGSSPAATGDTGSITLPAGWDAGLDTTGYLESWWLAGALWLLAAAVVGLVLWRGWRRRRAGRPLPQPVLRRTGAAVTVGALVLAAGAVTANAYVGYVPTIASAFGELGEDVRGGSRIDELSIGAADLDVPAATTYVYVPKGYDDSANAQRRYPVLYLLHGYPGGSADWIRAGDLQGILDRLIQNGLVEPMIAVTPDGNAGWVHDSEFVNATKGPQVETYIATTVPKAVDARYRTVADRSGRGIGGMSAGGFGALNVGLHNLDEFSVVIPMMPYGDPGSVKDSLFGGSDELLRQNSPSQYIPTMSFGEQVAIMLIAGTEDPQLDTARSLYQQLEARGVDVALQVVEGAEHTWQGATMDSPYGFVFFSRAVSGSAATNGG